MGIVVSGANKKVNISFVKLIVNRGSDFCKNAAHYNVNGVKEKGNLN